MKHTIADFQDELSEDLAMVKTAAFHLEGQVKGMLIAAQKAQVYYETWNEPIYPDGGTVSLFTTQRQLMLLVDKLSAINASLVYGDLAQLIDESSSDVIPF